MFLSFLYIRERFEKKGEQEQIRKCEVLKCTSHHFRFRRRERRGGLVLILLLRGVDVGVVFEVEFGGGGGGVKKESALKVV